MKERKKQTHERNKKKTTKAKKKERKKDYNEVTERHGAKKKTGQW